MSLLPSKTQAMTILWVFATIAIVNKVPALKPVRDLLQ